MNDSLRLLPAGIFLSLLLIIPNVTLAENIEGNVALPDNCTTLDKNGASHTFPKENSPSDFLAVCALAEALQTGLITSVQLSEFPGFGLFVEGLDGIVAGADEYWALWLNGNFAGCGIECLPLTEGDTISFILTSFEGEERGTSVVFHISSLVQNVSAPSPAPQGGAPRPPPSFDSAAALSFLATKQRSDGSFGADFITDWVAIALASGDSSVTRDAIRRYLLTHLPTLASVTDYERHAMALMALGINPYTGTPTDYIAPIVGEFDGAQIGSALLVNDDIFALFPLSKAGFSATDEIFQKSIAFIVARQKPNGSWEESVDLTAAAIQALLPFASVSGVNAAVVNARTYLHETQGSTGGWKNSFSTSWVLQAIHALGDPLSPWTQSGYSPLNFLGFMQLSDGGLEPASTDDGTRVWATAYAIPAALGKSWSNILQPFPRPEDPIVTASTLGENGLIASIATSTITPTNSQEATTENTKLPALELAPQVVAETERNFSRPSESTPAEATSTADETKKPERQIATAGQAADAQGTGKWGSNWIWLSGLFLILGALFYFFRRA